VHLAYYHATLTMTVDKKQFSFLPQRIHTQFFLYLIAAGVAAISDLSTVFLFLNTTNLHYLFAIAFGFVMGTSTNFIISSILVFSRNENVSTVYVKHFFSSLIGFAVNISVVIVCVEWFLTTVIIAKIIALSFSFFINFILIKFFAFRDMKI